MNIQKIVVVTASFLTLTPCAVAAQTNRHPAQPSMAPRFGGASRPDSPGPAAWDPRREIKLRLPTFDLATNFVVAKVETGAEVPSQIALIVKQLKPPATNGLPKRPGPGASLQEMAQFFTAQSKALEVQFDDERIDWSQAVWIPFTTTLPLDLGPGEGRRLVSIAARWGSPAMSSTGIFVRVDRTPPVITITNPTETVTSRPMIQLEGYTDEPVQKVRYDLINASNHLSNAEGYVNHQDYDSVTRDMTTCYFSCLDIELAPGRNTVVVRCEDRAGNVAEKTLKYVFTLEGDKTPPVISLDRPVNGHTLSGPTFTARGRVDDPTAQVVAVVRSGDQAQTLEGLVERNGYFWVEHIPLGAGANHLALTATDAAGNSSQTNLVVYSSKEVLTIDSVPADQLWNATVRVSGRVTPSGERVWVNGVEAKVNPDGTWVAERVPVLSPNGGTAVFEASTAPPSGKSAVSKPQELIAVTARLGTNAAVLNPGQPSCGAFDLHLNGVGGRAFVLYASTNLTDWTPLLTNVSAQETFEFTDNEAGAHKCRFFRVVPLP
jgi:hypothetical protein